MAARGPETFSSEGIDIGLIDEECQLLSTLKLSTTENENLDNKSKESQDDGSQKAIEDNESLAKWKAIRQPFRMCLPTINPKAGCQQFKLCGASADFLFNFEPYSESAQDTSEDIGIEGLDRSDLLLPCFDLNNTKKHYNNSWISNVSYYRI